MIEETKKEFEFPLIEIVKYDITNIINNPESGDDWDAGEF